MKTDRSSIDEAPVNAPSRRRWPRILKPVLTIVVLLAIGRYLWVLSREWRQQTDEFRLVFRPPELALSAALYLMAMTMFGLFWRRLLAESGIRIGRLELLRTYFVGALGKYVPGKALVPILRTGMVQHHHLRKLPIVLSIFYETLAMMAVGAAIAAACLLATEPAQWLWWSASLVVATGLGCVLHPALFEFFSRIATKPFVDDNDAPSVVPWFRALVRSAYLPAGAWMFLGLSCAATAAGLGLTCNTLHDLVLITGVVALASSAGFVVVFMPSGIGVREFVIVTLLSPRYGAGAAVAVSLVLRTIWTIADLAVAGAVYPLRPAQPREARTIEKASEVRSA